MGAGRGLPASSAVLPCKAWRARGAGQIAGAACWAAQALQGAQVCTSGKSALACSVQSLRQRLLKVLEAELVAGSTAAKSVASRRNSTRCASLVAQAAQGSSVQELSVTVATAHGKEETGARLQWKCITVSAGSA